MRFKGNRIGWGKILSLLILLLVVGLSGFGCIGIKSTPEGGSAAAIADSSLYVVPAFKVSGGLGCESRPTSGKLVAVDTSGNRLWETALETSGPARSALGCAPATVPVAIYGTPAVAGDLVYVGGYNGLIYAVSSESRALRWVYPRQGNLQSIVGGLVVAGGKIFFGCSDGKVYALDAVTGDKKWDFQTEDKIWATPTVDGDTLYIGSLDKKLYALSTADGSKKWEFKTEGAITSSALVYDGTVYIGSFDRNLYAVGANDGALRWKFMAENWFWASPVVSDNTIYASCLDSKVYALDAGNGHKVAEFDLGNPVSSSPVVVDGSIVVASEEGKIYSIKNNQKRNLRDLGAKVYSSLCASKGVVYIHAGGETLYALDAETGAELWTLSLISK